MRKFLTGIDLEDNLDLNQNELLNPVAQNLATAPVTPLAGQFYFNTADDALYWYNGTSWVLATGTTTSYGSVTAQTSFGASSSDGVSSSVARADHTHGTPSLSSTAATALAPGDSAATGVGTTAARADHAHSLPGFGSVTGQTSFGASSGNGVATTFSRSDHTHGTPTHDGAAHSTIPLSDLADPTSDVAFATFKITGLGNPTDPQDAATKAYVDGVALGLDVKEAVRVATTGPITLSGAQTIDGVSVVAGDRVLVKNQSTASTNGIYVAASGAWARSEDANTSAEVNPGMFTFVTEGTLYADTGWVLTTDGTIDLGVTDLAFAQFSGPGAITAGDGLTQSGNTINAVGTTDRISVSANAIDIASTYAGQNTIVTVGTITTGTWNGTDIAVTAGGTGASTAADARTNLSSTTSPLPQKFVAGTGPSTNATSWVITHNLGQRDVLVQVYDASTYAVVDCDITLTDANTVTLGFGITVTADTLRATIIG
jgi:hypothetical protein